MILHVGLLQTKEIDNNNDNEYILLTNIEKSKLDIVRLCIVDLDLKNDVIITNAYNIDGDRMPNHYGVYIESSAYASRKGIFDEFNCRCVWIERQLDLMMRQMNDDKNREGYVR